jgi:glycosyltransferase involved in cell wall biosynthesis
MKLIIQIPCYNEEETLELAYNDLPRHIDGIDTIEYLIINDGSKDNTVQKARELGFHHVVSFRRNKGLARGFMAGCRHYRQHRRRQPVLRRRYRKAGTPDPGTQGGYGDRRAPH